MFVYTRVSPFMCTAYTFRGRIQTPHPLIFLCATTAAVNGWFAEEPCAGSVAAVFILFSSCSRSSPTEALHGGGAATHRRLLDSRHLQAVAHLSAYTDPPFVEPCLLCTCPPKKTKRVSFDSPVQYFQTCVQVCIRTFSKAYPCRSNRLFLCLPLFLW